MATPAKPVVTVTSGTSFTDKNGNLTQYGMNTLLALLSRVQTLEAAK